MKHILLIHEIAQRGKPLGLSLRALCVEAGVSYASIHRWQTAGANPKMRQIEDALAKLRMRLRERETDLLRHLVGLHPEIAKAELAAVECASTGGDASMPEAAE